MKKITALLVLLAAGSLHAGKEFVTVDVSRLLSETKQAQSLRAELDAKVAELQRHQQQLSSQLQAKHAELMKRSKVLGESALQEELAELQAEERRMQRELQGMQEDLQALARRKENLLRNQLTDSASELVDQKGWGMMFDSSAPGVLACAKATDVTDSVLSHIDTSFEQQAREIITAQAEQAEDITRA